MEILWPTLGICVLVGFVFFVLAQHWQRLLRNQNFTIRRLSDRVRTLEAMDDPEFRRRLNESSPSPLEQVFTFSLRLSDRFWRETLKTTAEDLSFIGAFGSFLGSVKIERWRGHTVTTISEVLPARQSAAWQTRSLDCYFDKSSGYDSLTLWEVPLARVQNSERPPSLELALQERSIELCAHLLRSATSSGSAKPAGLDDIVLFQVPLDSAELAEFRRNDPLQSSDDGEPSDPYRDRNFWRAFYSHSDEAAGFEWQLWVRDLAKKAEWERWKILESPGDVVEQNAQKRTKAASA
ncbi:MAG TPA: hypothetical protein VN875_09775 [Candidatus Binatus sp.]|jgi:hypothetical protein|nr:hypothetical protein [Candidatus Binatus sp.]